MKNWINSKSVITLLALMISVSFVTAGWSMEQGNKRKGKYTYRKVYKACFERGVVDTKKPPVNPDSKTQAEWEALFEARQFEGFGCSEEWQKLSAKEVTDIFTYLYSYAADSPTPAKCK